MADTIEVWVKVPGTSGRYEVSDLGRVRSLPVMCADTRNSGPSRGSVLTTGASNRGYARFTVRMPAGRKKTFVVHQLVAALFIGPRPDGLTINHRNGVKLDNRAENLEYVTPGENSRHAVAMGLTTGRKGTSHHFAKLTAESVLRIRERYTGDNQGPLAAEFGVTKGIIGRVVRRETYTNV